MFKIIVSLLLLFSLSASINVNSVIGQELPPITNYSPADYGGDNQNWQTSQGADGVIYIANNKGLLSYNGAQWRLSSSPNETIIRSVKSIGDRIYTGAHMDFGYWEKQNNGVLVYTSLKDELGIEMLEGEQIWKISTYKSKVLLQSLNGIYIYNPEEEVIDYILIDLGSAVYRLFEIEDALYFQVLGKGLYTIDNGEVVLYSSHMLFRDKTFVNIFKRDTDWLGITQKNGFYTISANEVSAWDHAASDFLDTVTVYRSVQLSDGGIALGTIAHGFIRLTKDGFLDYQLTQRLGLGNNTVLSIFEDQSSNIWVGLDNGIACINKTRPIKNFIDQEGRLGTTYASVVYNGKLYLGTNQGLFYKSDVNEDFALVPDTEEQVWTLKIINGQLFCGHNKGTFLIDDGKAQLIGDVNGTWDIREIPNHPNLLLQGNYDGLYILQRSNQAWSLRNKLDEFNVSSRHFEFAEDYKILVGNEYKGVFEIAVDTSFAKAKTINLNTTVSKDEHSSLEKFDNNIYYLNKEGFYKYDNSTSEFKREVLVSEAFNDQYVSGNLVNDGKGRLWAFADNELLYLAKNPLESNLSVTRLHIPQALRNTGKGFENITQVESGKYILGTTNGYLNLESSIPQQTYQIAINQIQNSKIDGTFSLVNLVEEGSFLWDENTLIFDYNVPEFDKFQQAQYQHRLIGFYDSWSLWENKATNEYANIPSGNYTFQVRARVGNSLTINVASYDFTIGTPWYLSYLAIAGYIFLVILLFLLMNAQNKKRYRTKQEQLVEKTRREMDLTAMAAEKEIIELRNQNLRDDISARNRELASSTMSMVVKSKTLQAIKEKLVQLEKSKELDEVIRDIDKNISTKEDWSFFEEAFNHADKGFFRKVKNRHPELTTNDLKLCVYLRLNMTSKEIAPLLNISHRSVEIKRYRLRKKLNLDSSVRLNDYFIKF